jgi:hypothetical protein
MPCCASVHARLSALSRTAVPIYGVCHCVCCTPVLLLLNRVYVCRVCTPTACAAPQPGQLRAHAAIRAHASTGRSCYHTSLLAGNQEPSTPGLEAARLQFRAWLAEAASARADTAFHTTTLQQAQLQAVQANLFFGAV